MAAQHIRGGAEQACGEGQEFGTKTCPRCGAKLFDDMDICYGCLFDFSREYGRRWQESFPEGMFEDEFDGGSAPSPYAAAREPQVPQTYAAAGNGDPDDTAELGPLPASAVAPAASIPVQFALRLERPDVAASIPVGGPGLVVGRDESCDIVLRSRAVSRQHLQVAPLECGVRIINLGATNPTFVNGTMLEDVRDVPVNAQLDICGTKLQVVYA